METKATLVVLSLLQVAFGLGIPPAGPSVTSSHNKVFECTEPDGVFPAGDQCSGEYYLCVDGVAYPQHCPGSSVYNPETQVCFKPEDGSCDINTTTSTTSPSTSTTSTSTTKSTVSSTSTTPSFICPSPDGFFPMYPDTCTQSYYTCISNTPYPSTCPGDSVFDPVSLVCVPPTSASCLQEFQCPEANGFFPIPGTCSGSFYVCISGEAYIENCPAGAVFDPNLLACVPKENASC